MNRTRHFFKKFKPAGMAYSCGFRGFSIAELIIVIAIFSVITTVALLDQNRLNSGVLITNLGYETALAIREAQVYGVGVRNFSANPNDAFSGQFGTYFNISNPTQIVLFNDKDGNYSYDPGEEQYLYSFTNQRGNKITAICLENNVAGGNVLQGSPCGAASPTHVSELRVMFKRPSLEAIFYTGSVRATGPAYIVVDNIDDNNCRVVIIEPTGQIRVERADATNPGNSKC